MQMASSKSKHNTCSTCAHKCHQCNLPRKVKAPISQSCCFYPLMLNKLYFHMMFPCKMKSSINKDSLDHKCATSVLSSPLHVIPVSPCIVREEIHILEQCPLHHPRRLVKEALEVLRHHHLHLLIFCQLTSCKVCMDLQLKSLENLFNQRPSYLIRYLH